MSTELKPAYLICGDDEAKIAATRARLRARAERDGGGGALEAFEADGPRGPDVDALLAALAAMSLTGGRRYLLADGIEALGKGDGARVAEALGSLPEQTTLVLIARGKAPANVAKAVAAAGGEKLEYKAPGRRELPRRLVAEARSIGLTLEPDAARLLVERTGASPMRLRRELERLSTWAGEGGAVGAADLAAMVADEPEQQIWALGDAIVEGDRGQALAVAERLLGQGEALQRIVATLAPRLRQARAAAVRLEAGEPPKQVAESLSMHPYAARMLVSKLHERSPADLERSVTAIADLEQWSRGGADYDDGVALMIALRAAVGGEAG